MVQPIASPTLAFAEADIRRLCGDREFARGDAYERAGHVLRPTQTGPYGLAGTVRGTWRRRYPVHVVAQGRSLEGTCPCEVEGPCRHVAALLLHWVRKPKAFEQPAGPSAVTPGPSQALTNAVEETAYTQLARLLDRNTVAALRELARARGVALPNRAKPELVAQLATALAAPESVDAALGALSADERRTLDAIHLLSAMGPIMDTALAAAQRALGAGAGKGATETLRARGLVFREDDGTAPWGTYTVPRVVAARLAPLDGFVSEFQGKPDGELAARNPIGIDELLMAVAHELADRDMRRRQGYTPEQGIGPRSPGGNYYYGFSYGALGLANVAAVQHEPRQIVGARLLRAPDLRALARALGLPPAQLAFVTHLMAALGILEGVDRLYARDDRLAELLALPPGERRARLARAWLAIPDWTELADVIGEHGPFWLTFTPTYHAGWLELFYSVIALRRLAARLIGRLPPDRVYDGASFVRLLHALAPDLLNPTDRAGQRLWSFAPHNQPTRQIDPTRPEGWQRIAGELVSAMVLGPLAWLGFVEPVAAPPLAFRVLPAAGALVERELPAAAGTAALSVADDLTVRLPAGADAARHAFLARVGERVGAGAAGVEYRLTAERMHGAFEAGLTGPALIETLEEWAGQRLPKAARDRLHAWWAGYGTVRLYDELTLIELGEDALLPELLAATPLADTLVYQFAPRLVAVDPLLADDLIAQLTRRGYTPRVVEAS